LDLEAEAMKFGKEDNLKKRLGFKPSLKGNINLLG